MKERQPILRINETYVGVTMVKLNIPRKIIVLPYKNRP